MLCHYILAFKAGEKALAALSQGPHGLSWESVAGQERWSPWRRQSILSSQRRRLWHRCCPPSEIHLLALETLCLHFFSQKAEVWHWSFCRPSRPIARTGSSKLCSNCERVPHKQSPLQTCHTSQSCGAGDHGKNRPLRHGERGEVADLIKQPSPAVWGANSWLPLDVSWCAGRLCRRMFGIPQGKFLPADVWDSTRNIWSLSSQPGWLRVCLEYLHCKVPD